MTEYVHYGSNHFYQNMFVPIKNESYPWIKPRGGMWSSPVDSENTWEDWCLGNGYNPGNLDKQFRFILTEGSEVLEIKSNKDLNELYSQGYKRSDLDQYPELYDDMYYLDFEKILANGYDAIQITITNETYWSLYGWDCDTLLVLNPNCVIEIEQKGFIFAMESGERHRDTEIDDFAALKRGLIGLEQEYNSARQELFTKMRSYYNQSIASKFVKEDDLRRLLDQCEEIKQSYFEIQNKLMSKRPNNQHWSFRYSFKFSSQFSRKDKKNEEHD